MASNEIRISAQDMETRAGQYDEQASVVEEVIGRMDTLLAELQEEWKGKAAEAYAERYEELKPSFVQMKELINEIGVALRETAQSMDAADNANASRFLGN